MQMVDPQPGDWKGVFQRGRKDRKIRSLVVAAAAGVILVLLIGATNSVVGAARNISSDSRALSETDESVRAATVARTMLVLASVAVEEGAPPPDTAEVDDALAILDRYTAWSTREFTVAARALQANLLNAADPDYVGPAPDPALVASLENEFAATFSGLVDTRADLSAALVASEDRLNSISTLAGLALLFVVPTLSIAVYRAITKPDLDHAATAHAADLESRRDRRRRASLSDGLRTLRLTLRSGATPLVVEQQLNELSAVAGVGVDGSVRQRKPVDLRTAVVSAVNRVDLPGSTPISGANGRVMADDEQISTLLAAVIASAQTGRDLRLEILRESEHLVVLVSTIGMWDVEDVLSAGSTWDVEANDDSQRRLVAARALAADLNATLTPVNMDGRTGVRVALPASDEPANPDPAPPAFDDLVLEPST